MKYKEYKNINLAKTGKEVLSYWKKNNIFERSVTDRAGKPPYTFYEGPPSANGTPGIHHVMARTVKDIFCRYKTMQGFQVKRKGGWDTHGLPVELKVENELGITKEDIGKKISVAAYNQECRQTVMKFKKQWEELTEIMGFWIDLNDPYITFDNNYIESVWYLLKKLYEKKLLYKGYSIQPYSPAAGTGLSSHEINMPGCYREIKDVAITAQFKVIRDAKSKFLYLTPGPSSRPLVRDRPRLDRDVPPEGEGSEEVVFFLAWTTTPWTLPSNCALAVGKDIVYVKVKTYNQYTYKPISVILAKDLVENYFPVRQGHTVALQDYKPGDKIIPYEIVEEYKGKELEGVNYEQLMPYVQPEKPAFWVIIGDFVSTEEGTGIVHTASVFGADDYKVCTQNGIPSILVKNENGNDMPLVDKQGRFVKEVTDFAGRYVRVEYGDISTDVSNKPDTASGKQEKDVPDKTTDVLIAIKLKEENKAFRVEKHTHSYPHCWRTDKPILYYPLDSWFIKTTAFKDKLIKLNKTINWKPTSTGSGRFGNWLENIVDWNLSRSRYWGTPLPIWITKDGKEEKCIGSIEELKAEVKRSIKAGFMNKPIDDDVDLHRPYVDDVVLVSDKEKPMYREPDLIDVWFDSGAMPYAQHHYPFENKELIASFPADFIAEGVDQTRGWFFTLHTIGVMLFNSVAFKNVLVNGLVLDKEGNKMSKRIGNVVDPFETIKTYGPDATRWYMMENAPPWENLKFDANGIAEIQRRFFGTLHNTYSFFALYANLDHFTYPLLREKGEKSPPKSPQRGDVATPFASGKVIPVNQRTESDKWIISKLNSLILVVENVLSDYEPTKAARAIQDFVIDDLSNWYVRLNRKRYWKTEHSDDKTAAYQTLYECLETVARLASPIAPFYMEQLFLDLQSKIRSVHLTDFPEADHKAIDHKLEEKMRLAQQISSLLHSLRKKHNIKVRQPLTRILIPVLNKKTKQHIQSVQQLILSEVNVKNIEYIDDSSGFLVKKIKPDYKRLGKQYGPKMKLLAAAIDNMRQEDIAQLEKEGNYVIKLNRKKITLTLEDVEISFDDIPGWSVAGVEGITVALDINITDELRQEGIARELVNRIQNLRKDMGFEVQDKINIRVEKNSSSLINTAIELYKENICKETLALSFDFSKISDGKTINIDGQELIIKLEKNATKTRRHKESQR